MTTGTETCFGIIRHAPTLWNEQKRIQGQQDSPVSPRGRAMAETWGAQLGEFPWTRLVCSDLERVQQTARLLNQNLHLPVVIEPNLREQDWGAWTGMTLNEVKAADISQLRRQERRGWDFQPPGGESRREVLERCINALANTHAAWPGENILVVCHEGVLKCLLYSLLNRQFLPEEPKIILSFHLHLMAMQSGILSLQKMNSLALGTISEKDPE